MLSRFAVLAVALFVLSLALRSLADWRNDRRRPLGSGGCRL